MVSKSPDRRADQISGAFVASATALVAALLLGGGTRQGLMSDAVLQLICIPVLAYGLWKIGADGVPKHLRFSYALLLLVVALPLVQLVPLPIWISGALPYHAMLQDIRALAGYERGWSSISVVPDATAQAALSLIVPASIYLVCTRLNFVERRLLAFILIGVGVVSAILGLAQISQGQASQLRFFDITNPNEAVGFFANRNHLSALLYATWLFAIVCFVDRIDQFVATTGVSRTDRTVILPVFALSCAVIILIIAQLMARSRAGLILAGVAMVAALIITTRRNNSDKPQVAGVARRRLAVVGLALGVILCSQYAFVRVLERLGQDPLEDARIVFGARTYEAAKAFLPTGSGVGTFVPVYGLFERSQDALLDTYANRAHNDLLEAFLENGAAGVLLIVVFVAWAVFRTWRMASLIDPRAGPVDRRLAMAAAAGLSLLVLHSLVDYPFRTGALMAVGALFCSFLTLPAGWLERPTRDDAARPAYGAETPEVSGGVVPETPTPVGGQKAPAGAWGADIDWPDAWRRR